jgi:hypothetical protein
MCENHYSWCDGLCHDCSEMAWCVMTETCRRDAADNIPPRAELPEDGPDTEANDKMTDL